MQESSLGNTKEELRARYLSKRKKLDQTQFDSLNQKILQQIQKLELSAGLTIHIFLPIKKQFEPDTFAIMKSINDKQPTTRWVTSTVDPRSAGLYHFELDHLTLLKESKWGIPEPIGGYLVPEKEIDLVFIPLLVVDRSGHRVGYGKGYYDRFLVRCRPDIQKVGVSLFEPIEKIADSSTWDIPLDCCVTPQDLHHFNINKES